VRALFASLELIGSLGVAASLAGTVGYRLAARSSDARLRKLQQELRRSEKGLQQQRRSAEELEARLGDIEKRCRRFEHSLAEIPELAQQLAATRRVREIPEKALDLVQEVFQPLYSVFYRTSRNALVAVAVRGESVFAVGHRIQTGEGLVGWSALKRLAVTPEDLLAGAHANHLLAGVPEKGFSLCLPVTNEARTLGVILVGPCDQSMPRWSEIGRTVALITSVVITGAELFKEQNRLAETDGLTGLMNRTNLLARAKELLAADSSPRSVGFFLFDVDRFKHYNDTNGHLPGDELLKSLSLLLREKTREEELVGRYGGEEFLIVMPGADRDRALQAADRIRALIAATPFPHGEKQPGGCISVSGGISVWPIDGDDLETLLKRADEALYAAKRAGRNRVCPYATAELGRESESELVEKGVAKALLDDLIENGFGPEAWDAPPGLDDFDEPADG
jgi:diguanylate cyclase (GGDEF)-like protein